MSDIQETDREFIELAAKAAGIQIEWLGSGACWRPNPVFKPWHPLTNDAHALQLAVKLRMTIKEEVYGVTVTLPSHDIEVNEFGYAHEAATRRAIVLAAAALGKLMP
jgi:hypothetical protein